MIDFTEMPVKNKTYAGANGSKIAVMYNDERYMLKFPSVAKLNKNISYANGCVSEYIGCHIFESIGISAQKTLLGVYRKNSNEKLVVACRDFTTPGIVLQDFASLKNTIIDSVHNGYGTELYDILETIDMQKVIDPKRLKEWFWDMFIVDALIGNWDRHNGNWGFLYNETNDTSQLAPIYDCGSSLFPQADDKIMLKTLEQPSEMDHRIFNLPLSAIKIDDKKINYFDFITSAQYDDCNDALRRIVPKIDMGRINEIIDTTPSINDLQKSFYKAVLLNRKKYILDYALKKNK